MARHEPSGEDAVPVLPRAIIQREQAVRKVAKARMRRRGDNGIYGIGGAMQRYAMARHGAISWNDRFRREVARAGYSVLHAALQRYAHVLRCVVTLNG